MLSRLSSTLRRGSSKVSNLQESSFSKNAYYRVCAALSSLVVLTVGVAYFYPGFPNIAPAMTITIVKIILVILYMMHVRYNSRLTWLFTATGFLWLGILIDLKMCDFAVWNSTFSLSR